MGDNQLELEVQLQAHLDKLDTTDFDRSIKDATKGTDKLEKSLDNISKTKISNSVKDFNDDIKITEDDLANLSKDIDKLKGVASKTFDSVSKDFSDMFDKSMPELGSKFTSFFTEFKEGFAEGLAGAGVSSSLFDGIIKKASSLLPVVGAITTAVTLLGKAIQFTFGDSLTNAFNNIKNDFNSVLDEVDDEDARNRLKNNGLLGLAETLDTVQDKFIEFRNSVEESISGTNAAIEALDVGIDAMSVGVVKLLPKLVDLYETLSGYPSLVKAVSRAFGSLTSSLSSAANNLTNRFISALDIDLSKNFAGVDSVTRALFGDAASSIEDFADAAIYSMGETSSAAKEMVNTFATSLRTLGVSIQDAGKMSTELTQLSADLASVFNKSTSETFKTLYDGITKGTKGAVNALREYGVALDSASMQAYASANGLTTLYKNMSQAEQATLRYKKVMESLSSVQGAFVANSNTFSGQLKILKANFADLGNTISKIMQVVLLPAIKILNSFISSISGVIKGIAGIFGLDFSGISSQTVSSLGDMSDSASDLADSENDAADGINNAAKAAKKALAPFHKLNVLQSNDNSSSSSSSSKDQANKLNKILGSLENTVEGSVPTIESMLNNLADWLENLDIIKALSSLVGDVNKWLDEAIKDVKDFYDDLQPFIALITGVFDYLIENIEGKKIGELFAEVFGGAARSINTFLDNLHAGSFGIFVADIINGVAQTKSAFEELGKLISNLVNKKADFQLAFWTEADVSDWADSLVLALSTAINNISLKKVYAAFYVKLIQLSSFIEQTLRGLVNTGTVTNFAEIISSYFIAVGNYFAGDGYKDLLDAVQLIWNNFWSAFSSSMDAPTESGKSTWGNLKDGIVDAITGGINMITADDFLKTVYHIFDILLEAVQTVIDKFGKDSPITKAMEGFIENTFGIDFNMFFDLEDGVQTSRKELDKLGDSLYGLTGFVDEDTVAWQHFLSTHQDVAKKIDEGKLSIEEAKKANASYLADFQKLDPELRKAAENQALLNTSIKSTGDTLNNIDLGKAAIGLAAMGENVNQLRLDFTDGTTAMGTKYNEFLAVLQQGEAKYATLDKATKEYYAGAEEGIGGLLKEWVNYDTSFKTLTNEQIGLLEQYRLATDETSRANIQSKINEVNATENQKTTMLGYLSAIDSALIQNSIQEQTNSQAVKSAQEEVRNEYKTTEQSIKTSQSEVVSTLRSTATEAGTAGTDTGNAYNTGIDSTNPGGNIASNIIAGIQDPELQATVQEQASALGLLTGTNLGTELNNGITNSGIEETLNTAVTNGTTQAESTISTSASNIETNLSTTGTNISTNWSVTLSDIETNSTTTADNIYTYIDDIVTNKLIPLFNNLTDIIKQTFIDSVGEVESCWDSLESSVTSNMDSIKTSVDNVSSALDTLISKLKEAASAQREYNSAKAAESSSGSTNYNVQGYATGGVFRPNNPQLALLGDHKSQTEYALTTGHLQKIADMMSNIIDSTSTGSDQPITIPVYIGNEMIDKIVVKAGQMHNYRSNGR